MIIEKLNHLTLIKITGDDAASFLQGQLTNDIELASEQWQYSGYCTPKGRLLALFTIWRTNDTIYALLDKSLVESTLKRLRMYVMRSKVTIEEIEVPKYAVLKPSPSELLTSGFLNDEISNIENCGFVVQENVHCLSFGNRYLIITPNSVNNENVSQGNTWLKEDIKAGLPQVNAYSSELFIPQMLNLDVLNGINFKKGCYTGQEIVARMHYLGKLKQRMFVCTLNSSKSGQEIKTGDKIYSDTAMTSTVGNIVTVDDNLALAVLRLDRVEEANQKNEPFIANEETTLQVNQSQPYSLDIK